jgi:hypothetical protein
MLQPLMQDCWEFAVEEAGPGHCSCLLLGRQVDLVDAQVFVPLDEN